MIHAVVLIECEIDEIPEAARAIADLEGVSEVYSVTGEFDLVAIVRVARHEDLAEVIPGGVARVRGVGAPRRSSPSRCIRPTTSSDCSRSGSRTPNRAADGTYSGRSIATGSEVLPHSARSPS